MIIVRGIWGDQTQQRRRILDPHGELRTGIQGSVDWSRDHWIYVFGSDNCNYVKQCGYRNVVLLDDRSWAHPQPFPDAPNRLRGLIRGGRSIWWHKFKIWQRAFSDHGPFLWMDFDAVQHYPIDADLRRQIVDTPAPFRAPLYVQANWSRGALWRNGRWAYGIESIEHPWDGGFPSTPQTHWAARFVPGCGWTYIADQRIVDRAMYWCLRGRLLMGDQVLAAVLDEYNGRWIGVREYRRRGYHSVGYYYGRMLFPPRRRNWYWSIGRRRRHDWMREAIT